MYSTFGSATEATAVAALAASNSSTEDHEAQRDNRQDCLHTRGRCLKQHMHTHMHAILQVSNLWHWLPSSSHLMVHTCMYCLNVKMWGVIVQGQVCSRGGRGVGLLGLSMAPAIAAGLWGRAGGAEAGCMRSMWLATSGAPPICTRHRVRGVC